MVLLRRGQISAENGLLHGAAQVAALVFLGAEVRRRHMQDHC